MCRTFLCAVLVLAFAPTTPAHAGVVNPDISVIGQPTLTWHDVPGDPTRERPVFDVGETEFVFDSALNPYARGFFTASLADGQFDLEEGYFTILRGLPGGLALKGGKYRVGFGKLNPAHAHTYPFAERFGVLAAYLPGSESLNETGLDVSWRVPLPGTWSVTLNGDVLQGDSFRIQRPPTAFANDPGLLLLPTYDRADEPRTAWLGRLAAFAPVGDRSGVEVGFSATQGTSNVAAQARTLVSGADLKVKLWTGANAYVLAQGEYLLLHRDDAGWDGPVAAYTRSKTHVGGGYLFVDYNWARRYNLGGSIESFRRSEASRDEQSSFGLFGGLALMEESTAFRLDWRRVVPPTDSTPFAVSPPAENHLTLRVIYSMGPHKAHQF